VGLFLREFGNPDAEAGNGIAGNIYGEATLAELGYDLGQIDHTQQSSRQYRCHGVSPWFALHQCENSR
jgi:hypothetical protein